MTKVMTLWMGLMVGTFGNISYASSQKVVNVLSLQKQLTQKRAKWHSKESWVTDLSKEEIKKILGLKNPPKGNLDFQSASRTGSMKNHSTFDGAALEDSLDWRSYQGVNWLGPVLNQGNCGSCVAFAAVATLEAQTSISTGLPWIHPTFSPQALFSCGGGYCDYGWQPESASSYVQSRGVPDEACMPYTSGSTGEDVSCRNRCADATARSTRISEYFSPTNGDGSVEEVKAALRKGPLMTTLTVYEDFLAYGGGVYTHVTGDAEGGHAVSLVGYDDAKRAWLVRNSWGPEWGENGYIWVSWDDISGIGSETWGFSLEPSSAQLTISSPRDRQYVSETTSVTAQFRGLNGQKIQFRMKDSKGADVLKVPCDEASASTCTAPLNTATLQEGRYQISAETITGTPVNSQVREFYVINSEPKIRLSFTPGAEVDLSSPIKGRPEFNVTADSSPLPIEHLEFRAINESGKIISRKTNDFVLPHMKMGWRTNGVPNGKYKILFHGEISYRGKVYSADSNSYEIQVQN